MAVCGGVCIRSSAKMKAVIAPTHSCLRQQCPFSKDALKTRMGTKVFILRALVCTTPADPGHSGSG